MLEPPPGLRDAMRVLRRVLDAPIPVLLTGESGTGKEVLARYLHENGPRAAGPFVAIDCAAVPGALLESDLAAASGGTLLLDEVADLSLAVQAKILRVLGREPVEFDACVVSATNKDLRAEIAARRFREDLYRRLVGVHVHLPAPLSISMPLESLSLREARQRFERAFIEAALARAGGSRRAARKLVGMSREGFRKKLRSLGFPPG